jgi:hypothetical protein
MGDGEATGGHAHGVAGGEVTLPLSTAPNEH